MRAYWQLVRPHQWIKNTACLAGVVFGGRLGEPLALRQAALTFVAFSLAAAAVYVFNDIQDLPRDRLHPRKCRRPLASGTVTVAQARWLTLVLLAGAIALVWGLGPAAAGCAVCYLLLNLAYSLHLKHVVLVDVHCIALGFVLRLLAGIYAVGDRPTGWIVLCTFFLALFLGLAKRRGELAQNPTTVAQRPVLTRYTLPFLDSALDNTAVMAVVSYALFSASPTKNPSLVLTVPIVYYAIAHYKFLVTVEAGGEDPDRIWWQDPRIRYSVLLWLISYTAIDYGNLQLFR
ncbi:MAG: decaprenyl-phosphate phosphoribosyltransferase [Pseudanabaenaceae cyanobacterium]